MLISKSTYHEFFDVVQDSGQTILRLCSLSLSVCYY